MSTKTRDSLDLLGKELLVHINEHYGEQLTRAEVQSILGFSHGKIFDCIKNGKLLANKIPCVTPVGYQWLITKESLINFVSEILKKHREKHKQPTQSEKEQYNYQKLLETIFGGKKRERAKLPSVSKESPVHLKTKQDAISILKEMQLENIKSEYRIHLKRDYTIDIVGFEKTKLIAVECGDFSDKQQDFWEYFSNGKTRLYWLPYNAKTLFQIKPVRKGSSNA